VRIDVVDVEKEAVAAAAFERFEDLILCQLGVESGLISPKLVKTVRAVQEKKLKQGKLRRVRDRAPEVEVGFLAYRFADFERYRVEAREAYVAGDYERASRAYQMATRMNPVHAGSFAGLGAAQLALGKTDEGVAAYQEAVRLAPTHSGFHAALGRAYRAAGHDDLAEETYREALRLDRTNRAARRALRELRQR